MGGKRTSDFARLDPLAFRIIVSSRDSRSRGERANFFPHWNLADGLAGLRVVEYAERQLAS